MELFINNFSSDFEDVNEEVLLERRISPYVTLRPGDLEALLKLHSSKASIKCSRNHDIGYRRIDAIFEKVQLGHSPGESDDEKNEDNDVVEIVCNGADLGHVPVEFTVKGLRRHEMPVIGFYVDKRICPGFKYCVRRIESNTFLWGNRARTLESIGMGYASRLTFAGDQLNNNDCYFWSDSEPKGFAFSIQAVEVGLKFFIQDSFDSVVGEGVIEKICGPQSEISMKTSRSEVTKSVHVTLMCSVTYYRHHFGLKELVSSKNQEIISGEAVISKSRSCRRANLNSIQKVYLPRIGNCELVPDS